MQGKPDYCARLAENPCAFGIGPGKTVKVWSAITVGYLFGDLSDAVAAGQRITQPLRNGDGSDYDRIEDGSKEVQEAIDPIWRRTRPTSGEAVTPVQRTVVFCEITNKERKACPGGGSKPTTAGTGPKPPPITTVPVPTL